MTIFSQYCSDYVPLQSISPVVYAACASFYMTLLRKAHLTSSLDYVKTIKHRAESTYLNGRDIKNLNTFQILKMINKDSPKKLFTGVIPRSTLSFLTMGIGFVAYDKLNELLKN